MAYSKTYTKKGPGRIHNYENSAMAAKRRANFQASKRQSAKLIGAANGMAGVVEVVNG